MSTENTPEAAGDVEGQGADTDQAAAATNVAADGDDADTGDERGGNKEAAKYRTKLRDAEAQRDQLAERLTVMQRGQAEHLAAGHLADTADLWRDGLELAALLDEQGNLDAGKVAEAAQALRVAHPHWGASPAPKRNPAGRGRGLVSGAVAPDSHRPAVSWSGLLNTTRGTD